MEEGDLDEKGSLSYMEFEHIISRDPDFLRYQYISGLKITFSKFNMIISNRFGKKVIFVQEIF